MIVRSMTLNAPPVFISFRKPNHQDLLVGLTEGSRFGRFNEARRNPDNHGVDEFNLSNAIKLPAKMHILAEEGLYPNSVRHFVDTDGLQKIELRNIETLSRCAHVCLDSEKQGKASRFVAQIKAFCTKDPITGEKVGIDLEVRGSMDIDQARQMAYSPETVVVITHPALRPGANPHVLKRFPKNGKSLCTRYTCKFHKDTRKTRWPLSTSHQVHESVASRMV
jgi:hypothetical protein